MLGGSNRARRGSLLPASAGNVWVALASTVVVFAGLALIIVNSPGWPKVKHAFFDPAEFRAYFATIGHAFVLNIKIFLVAEVLILILALVLAVMRSLPGAVFFPIRLLAIGYTDLFRGIPTILLVYLFGFGIPTLQLSHVTVNPVYLGAAALVVVYTAYVSEVYRAGIESVHPSQEAAARSLGLTRRADDADGNPAPGGAARDPAVIERLHRAAEGHGADIGAGAGRGAAAGDAGREQRVQLHALRGGRLLLRADHGATSTADRLADRTRP